MERCDMSSTETFELFGMCAAGVLAIRFVFNRFLEPNYLFLKKGFFLWGTIGKFLLFWSSVFYVVLILFANMLFLAKK